MWCLWRERNSRCFEDNKRTMQNLKLFFFRTLMDWLSALRNHSFFSILDLLDLCNFYIWLYTPMYSGVSFFDINKSLLIIKKKKKKKEALEQQCMALLHKIRKRLSCQLGNSIISWTSWRESCSWLHVFSNWVLLCSCQAELVQVLKRNQVGRGGLQSSMLWTFVLPWSQVCSERGGHSGRGYWGWFQMGGENVAWIQ